MVRTKLVPEANFDLNPYRNSINVGGNDNPLAGEPAFTGGDGGQVITAWGESRVNLFGLAEAGDTVQFRFEMSYDGCNGVLGWYVDDVNVYSCSDEVPGALCGNSVLNLGETCDDGNNTPGDGCSNLCLVEDGFTCTAPTAGGQLNAVGDGSFESGVPNASWTPFSTFTDIPGFPICTAANCAGVDLPNTGDWYVWIGGLADGVTSSVEQTLVIPEGETEMTLQVLRGVCDAETDTLDISIDSAIIDQVVCDTTDGAYTEVSVDISAYADGGNHVLNIGGTVGGTNGSNTNFFVDDVFIDGGVADPSPSVCTPVPTEEPLACNGPAAGFEYGILSNWTVIDNAGNGVVWTNLEDSGIGGNYTGGEGGAAGANSDANQFVEFDTELRTPVMDLSGYANVSLEYKVNYQNLAGSDFLDVDVSTDGGNTWTELLSWNEDHGSPLRLTWRDSDARSVGLRWRDQCGRALALLRSK